MIYKMEKDSYKVKFSDLSIGATFLFTLSGGVWMKIRHLSTKIPNGEGSTIVNAITLDGMDCTFAAPSLSVFVVVPKEPIVFVHPVND